MEHEVSKVKLEFFGHSYHLTHTEGDEIDLGDLVRYVEKVASEITKANPNLPAHKQIVLTVLSIARDYYSKKKELERLYVRLESVLDNFVTSCNSNKK